MIRKSSVRSNFLQDIKSKRQALLTREKHRNLISEFLVLYICVNQIEFYSSLRGYGIITAHD